MMSETAVPERAVSELCYDEVERVVNNGKIYIIY